MASNKNIPISITSVTDGSRERLVANPNRFTLTDVVV